MSAFDPTIEPDDTERRLRSWMADQRAGVDLTSTYARIVEQTGSSRPRPAFLVSPSLRRSSPPAPWQYRWARLAPVAIAVLLLALAILAGVLVGSQLQRGAVVDPAVELERQSTLSADRRYTSGLFEPKVTFSVSPRNQGGLEGDICMRPRTSSRTIVLSHPKGCVQDLRFIRPWAVACGSAGEHPDSATLAAAILAIPAATNSVDLGDIQAGGGVPSGTFREPYHGRVVQMKAGGPTVRSDISDPDHCTLLPEPGTDDPIVEIRHDIGALFVLLDVDGELVVIRASADGHDSGSHQGAVATGYATADDEALIHLLGLVRDIRFGP